MKNENGIWLWTEEDIEVGTFITKPSKKELFFPDGWNIKWTDMIGWMANSGSDKSKKDKRYCLINIGDGMILGPYTKQEMADSLNREKRIPCPPEWLRLMLASLKR